MLEIKTSKIKTCISIFALTTVIEAVIRQMFARPSCIDIAATSAELDLSAHNSSRYKSSESHDCFSSVNGRFFSKSKV